jgi:hypothetical protein
MGHRPGQAPCPLCLTKRVESCGTCQATGLICEEIEVTYTAETQFRLRSSGLPSAVNRTMDRMGLQNLGKGHADIETYQPSEDEEFELKENRKSEALPPLLHYRAKLPYAEMKLSIKKKSAVVSVFGKRGLIVSAPHFLDDALELARDNLALAAQGKAELESATQARAIRDAVNLHLSGHGTLKDFRKLYPTGLSHDVAKEIIANSRRALNRATLIMRAVLAIVITLAAAGSMTALVISGLHHSLTAGRDMLSGLLLDIGLLAGLEVAGWAALAFGLRFILMHKFPSAKMGQKHALIPKTGKTGTTMQAAVFAVWAAGIYVAAPLWLMQLIHR